MKKKSFLLAAIFTALMIFNSCSQEEENGRLILGLDLVEETLQKAAVDDEYLTTALVTIMGEDGSIVYDKEPLELIRFGSGLVTRSLKLPAGGFIISEFMLTDASGMVLWATPLEGSKLAGLVDDPLPRYFKIHPDESSSVDIQVVRVGNYPPEDFGYAQFNIDFIKRFCLQVQYNSRCPDYEYDSLMLGPDGTYLPYYQSRLMVYASDRFVLDELMIPGLNKYELPVLTGPYMIMATGCTGDTIFKRRFSLNELSMYRCSPDLRPLMIPGNQDPDLIITPEGLYEPSIRQGLFGQITGPLDSFMDSSLYDFEPQVQDIYLFPYHLLDSIYTFAPIDCYIPADMLPMEPLAKVRSNSQGYFQIKLEEGEYLYAVKREEGFYIDAFVSSHRPGYVLIKPGEVTWLYINLMDCSMWM